MTDQNQPPMERDPSQHGQDPGPTPAPKADGFDDTAYAELAAGTILGDLDPVESSAYRVFERETAQRAAELSNELEEAAALAMFALAEAEAEPMPESLTVRLQRAAGQHVEQVRSSQRTVTPVVARIEPGPAGARVAGGAESVAGSGLNALGWFGWVAAAACLALLISVWRPGSGEISVPPTEISLVQQYNDLAASPGSITATWQDVVPDIWPSPEAAGVTGDVVWSPDRQAGYLRLVGMPVNDPADEQYQLWIVDAERGIEQRIDGGVFDVDAEGEVIVPIDARLNVGQAFAFAITIEQPGGVVVSDMTRRGPIAVAPQG